MAGLPSIFVVAPVLPCAGAVVPACIGVGGVAGCVGAGGRVPNRPVPCGNCVGVIGCPIGCVVVITGAEGRPAGVTLPWVEPSLKLGTALPWIAPPLTIGL